MRLSFHQKAVILDATGRLLALRASYKGRRWDLPGGAVEIPEHHEEALRREVLEETGLEVIEVEPVAVSTGYNEDKDEYFLFIGYTCQAREGHVRISREHSEYRWVSHHQFLGLETAPYLKEFVGGLAHSASPARRPVVRRGRTLDRPNRSTA